MKILLTGGGTGGHIYPALAFIKYVKSVDPTSEFMYIGAKRGLENKILPQTDIPFQTLEIQGFKRSLSVDNLKTLQLFFRSMRQAKKILRDFQPDVVIGTGDNKTISPACANLAAIGTAVSTFSVIVIEVIPACFAASANLSLVSPNKIIAFKPFKLGIKASKELPRSNPPANNTTLLKSKPAKAFCVAKILVALESL